MNGTAALRGWTESGFRSVLLPTGSWIRVRLPSIDHLLRRGVFPHELEGIVLRYTMESFRLADLDHDEMLCFLEMKDRLVAYCVRQRLVDGDPDDAEAHPPVWEDVDLSPHLANLEDVVPAEDLDLLGLLALRQRSPEAVTAQSRINLGVAKAIDRKLGEDDRPPAAEDFRGLDNESSGDRPSSDSENVPVHAERAAVSGARRGRPDAAGSGDGASDRSGALSPRHSG